MIEKNLRINDLLVNYCYWPPVQFSASKQTVIFLHGWRAEGRIWGPTARQLGREDPTLEIYAPDLPGFGRTQKEYAGLDRGTPGWMLQDYAAYLREFIDKLKLSSVIVVGHSFGGRIALKLASQNSKWLQKLILVDSAGLKSKPRFAPLKKILAKLARPLFLPSFMRPLRKQIYTWLGAEDYTATPELTKVFLNVLSEDLTPLLSQIKIPTLLIWGEQDRETPLWMGKQLHSQIPDSRFQILRDAGHFSFLDQPEEFVNVVRRFIDS